MDLDGVKIACPRCDEAMDPFIKRNTEVEVTADMCLRCGGVWLDGAEVRRVHPVIAALIPSAAARPARSTKPLPACPRCKELPSPLVFFELELDVCTACKGVWVDGDELADLARTRDHHVGLHPPEARSYRDNASEALRLGRVTCSGCSEAVDLEGVEPTSLGPLCHACAEKYRERLFERELAAYEVPKNPILELPSFEDVGRGLRAVASLVGVALAGLPTRCSACGCHRYSRCGH